MGIPLENSSQGFPLRPLTPPTRPLMSVCAKRQRRECTHKDMLISVKSLTVLSVQQFPDAPL